MLEDLAAALGCAVADLTGQPYPPVARDTAHAMTTVPGIEVAVYDCTLADVPGIPIRPLPELIELARQANAHCDETRYALAGRDFGMVLAELHVHVVTGDSDSLARGWLSPGSRSRRERSMYPLPRS